MQDQHALLQQIGLTELEARVYIYFLENGASKVTDVYKALGTDKSSTYRVVENLTNRGLLVGLSEEYGKQFVASDPKLLLNIAKQRQEELKVASNAINGYVDNLLRSRGDLYKRENITIYEGEQAYSQLMEKRLEVKPELIREVANAGSLISNVPGYNQYMDEYVPRRIELGIPIRSIDTEEDRGRKYEGTDPKILKEVRYMPSQKIQSLISTFGDYLSIYNEGGERKLGILIKDPMIAQTINVLFDVLWLYLDD